MLVLSGPNGATPCPGRNHGRPPGSLGPVPPPVVRGADRHLLPVTQGQADLWDPFNQSPW